MERKRERERERGSTLQKTLETKATAHFLDLQETKFWEPTTPEDSSEYFQDPRFLIRADIHDSIPTNEDSIE